MKAFEPSSYKKRKCKDRFFLCLMGISLIHNIYIPFSLLKKYMNKKTKDNLDISKFNLEEFDDLNVYSTSLIMSFHFSPKKIYWQLFSLKYIIFKI